MVKNIRCLALLLSSLLVGQNGWADSEGLGDVVTVLTPVIAIGATALKGDDTGGSQLLYSLASTSALTYGLNQVINKETPDGDSGAFPSGHSAITFASATYMQRRYGWHYGLPAYGAAAFAGWSRVDADRHDWLDVAGGLALGTGCALLFTDSATGLSVTPWPDSQGHIAGILVSHPWR